MAFLHLPPATPRSICFRRSAASVVLAALLVPGTALLPRAGAAAVDAPAIERGRSAGRALLILRDPKVCAIALVRERCKADVDGFLGARGDSDFKDVPNVGPHPATGLRAFVTAGDRDGFDRALVYVNSTSSTPAMWSADARSAALYDAGIEDVLLPAARGSLAEEWLGSGSLIDLANHAAQIPAQTFPIDVAPIQTAAAKAPAGTRALPSGAMTFAHDLVKALDASMPVPPLATLTYAPGAAGDAALGVASSTVAELVDSPPWLAQADAQRFIDDYCARLAVVAPDRSAHVRELRAALRTGASFSHDSALSENTAVIGTILQTQAARTKPILIGSLAAQFVYNAAVFRDPRMSAAVIQLIGTETALDGAVPGWSAARSELKGIGATDWSAQYRAGVRLVDLIQKANPA